MEQTARLKFQNIFKSFGDIKALTDVSFHVAPGEIHGLMGENGAGKSTLLRTLSGVFKPTSGSIFIDGAEAVLRKPMDAIHMGVAMIHQELQQVPNLTVAQNMYLGHSLKSMGGLFVSRHEQERRAAEVLEMLDPSISPSVPIASLKVAQRQIVEIAGALLNKAKIIAMDEPTSSLTPNEFEKLVDVILQLSKSGVSIIYVSHKMDEVFRICERASIMRDGKIIGNVDLAKVSHKDVITMMVGRELMDESHQSYKQDKVHLEAINLCSPKIKNVSFQLHRGEILGIAGLVGAGRTELLRLIAGVDPIMSGEVRIDDKKLKLTNPRAAISAGIGLVPEERKRDGIIPGRSVSLNMALPSLPSFTKAGVLQKSKMNKAATTLLKKVNLRPFELDRQIRFFSGGNQQKAIIARWLATKTEVFLFDEPTRGIDIGAKDEIYHLIEELAKEGYSIIVVSSELPEIIRLSDRVMVICEGQISGILEHSSDITEQAIVSLAMPGVSLQPAQSAASSIR